MLCNLSAAETSRTDARRVLQAGEIGLFPLPPRRLGHLGRIGAAFDDLGDRLAKAAANLGQGRQAALVLHGVVQQGGYGLVLAAAVFHHHGGDGQQMGQVRPAGKLSPLLGVQRGGISNGFEKAGRVTWKLQRIVHAPRRHASAALFGVSGRLPRHKAARRTLPSRRAWDDQLPLVTCPAWPPS